MPTFKLHPASGLHAWVSALAAFVLIGLLIAVVGHSPWASAEDPPPADPPPSDPVPPPPGDADADGIPDIWEDEHYLDPANPEDAALDFDQDGLTAFQEWEAGTNPLGEWKVECLPEVPGEEGRVQLRAVSDNGHLAVMRRWTVDAENFWQCYRYRTFVLSPGSTTWTEIGPPEGSVAIYPNDVNNQGTVVGSYIVWDDNSRVGFVFENGELSDYPSPSGIDLPVREVRRINDLGDVIAYAPGQTFLETGGVVQILDEEEWGSPQFTDLNDYGEAIGTYTDPGWTGNNPQGSYAFALQAMLKGRLENEPDVPQGSFYGWVASEATHTFEGFSPASKCGGWKWTDGNGLMEMD